MSKKNIALIVTLVLVIILAIVGIVLGVTYYRNNRLNDNSRKYLETFDLTLEDMNCNIKDSKRILRTKITIETNNEKTLEVLDGKRFLIRDDINKIIRNKTEEELNGKDGQIELQNEIKESLIELFNDEAVTNVYFNDLIMQ